MTDHPTSEAVEMYLLRIALLQEGDRPVAISALAEELAVSPVSANQMCRRLEERDLLTYQPYKGVVLTLQGEAIAMRVLRKRRLWEVFLAEKLAIEPHVAEEMACRFEHVTPEGLAERLAQFLGNPTLSPQREPIPPRLGNAVRRPLRPLTTLAVGQKAQIVNIATGDAARDFVRARGLTPGVEVTLLAAGGDGAFLVSTGDQELTLARALASQIDIVPIAESEE